RLPLAAAADHDRDVAPDRLRVVEGAVDGVVLALIARRRLGEHGPRDVEVGLEALEALAERREVVAVRRGLLDVPAGADPVDGAAGGADGQGGRGLGGGEV